MKNVIKMLVGASVLAAAGASVAQEPATLSDAQMDGVTAGAVVLLLGEGIADSGAAALANTLGLTDAQTEVVADPTGALTGVMSVVSLGSSASLATSVTDGGAIGGAQAASAATAAASLQ